MPKVTFIKEKKTVEVAEGANLRREALKAGIPLYRWRHKYFPFNCLGHGTCATCRVLIRKGMENASPKTLIERIRLAVSWVAIGFEDQMRLACQTRVMGDMEVETQPPLKLTGDRFWE